MKQTPYNTGKVQIGLLYRPEGRHQIDYDASLIQTILITKRGNAWSDAFSVKILLGLILVVSLWELALFAANAKF
jgi:hypothetical protein